MWLLKKSFIFTVIFLFSDLEYLILVEILTAVNDYDNKWKFREVMLNSYYLIKFLYLFYKAKVKVDYEKNLQHGRRH